MLVAADSARGNAVTMSAGVSTRWQKTDTAENNASPSSAPPRPLVSWNDPWPSVVVGGWPMSARTGTRLANDSPSPGMVLRAPPPDVAATMPIPAPARL